jgi:hypothetical protein
MASRNDFCTTVAGSPLLDSSAALCAAAKKRKICSKPGEPSALCDHTTLMRAPSIGNAEGATQSLSMESSRV